MKVRKIERTAAVAWSPGQHQPLLALGTVAGALDASFSSTTDLEIFDLQSTSSSLNWLASVTANARFNRLAWGTHSMDSNPYGIIAAGKENGELDIWNPSLLLDGKNKEALVLRHASHGGPVRGLDFNPIQTNLLASGATDGEIFIWDMNNPAKPFSPGARSQRLEDVTAISWNKQVPHILATASNNGYTVVWDLRNRRELIKLAYPGGRKPITGIAWNPDAPTQLVSVADDDQNPMLLVWDLKNASAPEKSLAGHTKGILSVDWCPKDSDLVLTAGKDNRAIVWDVTRGESIGDLAHTSNWAFESKWYPRNPDLSVIASYDGHVGVHSLQSKVEHPEDIQSPTTHLPAVSSDDDPFANIAQQQTGDVNQPQFTLPHPPKWFRRPVGAAFGFGGKLVTFDHNSQKVSLQTVAALQNPLLDQIDLLEHALASRDTHALAQFAEKMAALKETARDSQTWAFLAALFSDSSRDDILRILGFDKSKIADDRLEALFNKLNVSIDISQSDEPPKSPALPFSLFSIGKPTEDSDIDALITKAVLIGDFDSAVNICVSANRFADAMVLAVNGGEELLYKTQKAYFKKSAKFKPYARILQSIVDGDLGDIVDNVRVDGLGGSWKDAMALICTYASTEDFGRLLTTLGNRLQASVGSSSPSKIPSKDTSEKIWGASLCFAAAGSVEKVIQIWSQEAVETEKRLNEKNLIRQQSQSAHFEAVQNMVLLSTVCREAFGFIDPDYEKYEADGETSPEFQLSQLYSAYADYAVALAGQGKFQTAFRFLELIPPLFISHQKEKSIELQTIMDRIYHAGGYTVARGNAPAPPFTVQPIVDDNARQQAILQEQLQALQQKKRATAVPSYNASQNGNQYSGPPTQPQWPQDPNNGYPPVFPAPQQQTWNPPAQFTPPPFNPSAQHPYSNTPNAFVPNGYGAPVQQAPSYPGQVQQTNGYPTHEQSVPSYPRQIQQVNQTPPSSLNGVTPPPPISSKHASGDRSHISPAQRPCYEGLNKHLEQLKNVTNAPQNKKLFEDAEKRLGQIFDALNNAEIPQDVVDQLLVISQALDKSDFALAHKTQMELMTKRFDVVGPWIVGIKRLIDTLERASSGSLDSPPVQRRPSNISNQSPVPPPAQLAPPPSGFGQPPRPSTFQPPPPIQSYQQPSGLGPRSSSFTRPNPPPTDTSSFGPPPVRPPQGPGFVPSVPQQSQVGPPPTSFVAPPASFGQTSAPAPQGYGQNPQAFTQPPPPRPFNPQGFPSTGQAAMNRPATPQQQAQFRPPPSSFRPPNQPQLNGNMPPTRPPPPQGYGYQ